MKEVSRITQGHGPASVDTLGFDRFVTAVHEHLTDQHSRPITLSVEGEWGSGKSSFMQQLRRRIEERNPDDFVVWFNAWRHDKHESVWAAFAVELVRQLNRAVWSKHQGQPWLKRVCTFAWWRLKTSLRLALRRFDRDRGWQDAVKTLCLLAVWVVLLIYAFSVWLGSPPAAQTPAPATQSTPTTATSQDSPTETIADDTVSLRKFLSPSLALLVALLSTAMTLAHKLTGNPMRYNLRKYARGPNYEDKVAFIEKFHSDFNKVVSVIAGRRRVYVFIDDLDRCEVPKAADLLQALNLMIPDEHQEDAPAIVYILGLDREKVSAGLAVKFKELLPYLSGDKVDERIEDGGRPQRERGLQFGYSFIEKFIQLPFLIPRAEARDLTGFVDAMFPVADQSQLDPGNREEVADRPRQSTEPEASVPAAPELEAALPQTTSASEALPTTSGNQQGAPPGPEYESRAEWQEFLKDPRQRLHQLTRMVAPAFGYNPRAMRHFIDLFRLRARIYSELCEDRASVPRIYMEQLAKFVAISLRWPLLLHELRADSRLLSAIVDQAEQVGEREHATAEKRREAEGPKEQAADEPLSSSRAAHWCQSDALVRLIVFGTEQQERGACFSLRSVDVGQLLSTVLPLWNIEVSRAAQEQADDQAGESIETRDVPESIRRAIRDAEKRRLPGPASSDYWVSIQAGEFMMGAQKQSADEPNYDKGAWNRESPPYRVAVAAFRLGRYPVTVGEYAEFVNDSGYEVESHWKAGGFREWETPDEWARQKAHSNRPVTGVSWYEAAAYAAWAKCRLPTESEWEYAARGTDGRRYPWGREEIDVERGNFNCLIGNPTPVGTYELGATPEGIADLAGNVWEWCEDKWHGNYAGAPGDGSAWTTGDDQDRVLRGGSWLLDALYCRSAFRLRYGPGDRGTGVGFRVASGTS